MIAFVFPGQGAQFPEMGKTHYDNSSFAKKIFEHSNEILGFRISDVMFAGTEEDLKQTNITQPAIFLHSIIAYKTIENAKPDMVAGHSLGEFSSLVANKTLSFEDALKLVSKRAMAMQRACEINPSTMAVVLGMEDATPGDLDFNDMIVQVSAGVPEPVPAALVGGVLLLCILPLWRAIRR